MSKDPESLEETTGGSPNRLASTKDHRKTGGCRLKCSHILVIIAFCVMSLDAYMQLTFRDSDITKSGEGDLSVSSTEAKHLLSPPEEKVVSSQEIELSQEEDLIQAATVLPEPETETEPKPVSATPTPSAGNTNDRSAHQHRRGRSRSNRRGSHSRSGSDQGAKEEDTGGDLKQLRQNSGPIDLTRRLKEILQDLRFAPTYCEGRSHNISSKLLITKSSVDSSNKVNYEKGGKDHRQRSKLNLEEDFVRLLQRNNFLEARSVCHKTCAIVGNSGTMLHKDQGDDIDSHEAVLRINYPPIHRYEKHVGSKTTYDFSNRENARRMLRSRMRWRNPRTRVIFFEGSSPVNRRSIFGPLLKKHPEQEFDFLHPQFVNNAQAFWMQLKDEMEKAKGVQYHSKPMSGIFAVLFMLQICEQVDMYGFEAYTKRTKESPYHYFDKVQGVTQTHSFDLAIEVFQQMGTVLPLKLK